MKIQLKNLFLYNFHIDVLVYGYICKMAMNITFNHHTINKCTLWHLFQRNKGMLHTRTPVHKRYGSFTGTTTKLGTTQISFNG